MYTDTYNQQLASPDGRVLRVRSLQATDVPLLTQLLVALSAASRRHWRPGYPYTSEGAAEAVKAAARPDEIHFLVLTDDDEPVGYGLLYSLKRPVPTLGIVIADKWQNMGIGRLFMRFLVDVAKRMRKEGVNLTVDDDNPRAIRVYEETGFQLVRLVREMRLDFPST